MHRSEIHFPPRHEALREDVHALGALVGQILKEQGGAQLLEMVEQDRIASIRGREGDAGPDALAVRVRGRPPTVARDLVRAFSMWFQAVNLAEKVHRIRRRRAYFLEASDRPQPGGVEDAVTTLKEGGASLDEVLDLIGQLRIEPVFTAHPTESTRRTILRKQQRVAQLMLDRLDPTLTPVEQRGVWGRIRAELTTGWQTEEHPRERLTVADEREHVLFYLAEVLYRVVPAFYDELAQALEKHYGVQAETLALPPVIHFGSWVGGDMDGNPDVHAKSIRETLLRQQQVIVNSYFGECQELAQKLSQSASRVNVLPQLSRRIEQYDQRLPAARASTPARHDRMPYRVFLAQISERLRATYDARAHAYEGPDELRADVQLIAESLKANRGWNAGLHSINRLLRRIDTFGFHLAALDVRQHTRIHHEVLARGLDDAHWLARSPAERRALLIDALTRDMGPRRELDALGKRTLAVFDAIIQARHRHGREAVGHYVVSGVSGADDVLAALLLARWAEAYDKGTGEIALDIAPLFESVETLEASGQTLRELMNEPLYRRHLEARGRQQCVLIGYSDANKEAGLCASRLATWRAQQAIAGAAAAAGERHVIFHGRGGSIPRGGGRVDALVRAAPSDAVNGVLRLTEQGEVVSQSYGLRPIAMRTLERAFNSLSLRTKEREEPLDPSHIACAATLAAASRAAYRKLVYGESAFYEWFRAVTPVDVIERMQIGSRPAFRPGSEGLDGLRAVPWVFAWTQSRHMLPGWYGAGAGLAEAVRQHGIEGLRRAYDQWFFFRNLVDDIEAMLARTDLQVAAAYNVLAPTPLHRFFAEVRSEFNAARGHLLEVKRAKELLDGDPTLQRSIQLRNPYVDPMNLMQVDLLARWRAAGRADRDLLEALLASISGIAQGLQSTG
jgi:phosphoenolpyruvate carboxylase